MGELLTNLTPCGNGEGGPVFRIGEKQWQGTMWDSPHMRALVLHRGAERMQISNAYGSEELLVTVSRVLAPEVYIEVVLGADSVESAAAAALDYQWKTKQAADIVWYQVADEESRRTWRGAFGAGDCGEITWHQEDGRYEGSRIIQRGSVALELRRRGLQCVSDEGTTVDDGRLFTFEGAAHACALLLAQLAATRRDALYSEAYNQGRTALKEQILQLFGH